MLSASPTSLARSSLEEMLDSLRRRDEEEKKPKDLPPALPARPTSKARLPSARRSLPNNFKVDGDPGATEAILSNGFHDANEETKRKDTEGRGHKRNGSLGSKKMKRDVESPYAFALEEDQSDQSSVSECLEPSAASSTAFVAASSGKTRELNSDHKINYFIKKVTENRERRWNCIMILQ